jgi:hypothetical protein
MSGWNGKKSRSIVDRFGEAAMPKSDSSEVSGRPAWWWIFFMPGKVILWIEYMFPHRLAGVFGSARRRNIPLIQILYSVYFYVTVAVVVLILLVRVHSN